MGNALSGRSEVRQRSFAWRAEISKRVEARTSKLSLSGRYHRFPQKLEADYKCSEHVLGTGANGKVRLIHSRRNGGRYALKTLSLEACFADVLRGLETEVDIFLSLDHPHIVSLVDVYETRSKLHLVMECLEGGDLCERVIQLKRFSEDVAADALYQMLLAVNYLHQQDMVHCDLKPENFLYDAPNSDHLKLADFGLTRIWDSSCDSLAKFSGTLEYTAPEVIGRNYTNQCDVWSLGVIAFVLLTGDLPFAGPRMQLYEDIPAGKFHMPPAVWDRISAQAQDFVLSLLQVDPNVRLTAVGALNHTWMDRTPTPTTLSARVAVDLGRYAQGSSFRRKCWSMMTWSLQSQSCTELRDIFLQMDKSKSGVVTYEEFTDALSDVNITGTDIFKMFHALDSNADGKIEYSEFVAALAAQELSGSEEKISDAFGRFDTAGTGFLTVDSLGEVLGAKDAEEVKTFVAEADVHGDGMVGFDTFLGYMKQDAGRTAVSTSDRQHPRLEQCAKGLRRRLFIARRKKVHNVRCKSMGWQNVSQMTLPRLRTFQWVCDASGGGSP